jgi:hypothetical protein
MAEACRERWGSQAKDRVADYYNAGSVRCWTPAGNVPDASDLGARTTATHE